MKTIIKYAYIRLAHNPEDIKHLYVRKGRSGAWSNAQSKDFVSVDGHVWHILYSPHQPRNKIWGQVIPFRIFINDEIDDE